MPRDAITLADVREPAVVILRPVEVEAQDLR
jgi:hypothetical protein